MLEYLMITLKEYDNNKPQDEPVHQSNMSVLRRLRKKIIINKW